MNRTTEQNSKWFVTDMIRHANRAMEHMRTKTTRLFVTEINQYEMGLLREHFRDAYVDNTGHVVIKRR